ncbi:septum formation inhibitor Maf [Campylobacter helveticus]|uniref:Septum formation inhibitor Maf n=1 Tax=Campylobacter helveticus TaxID=28898 RepID=A0AAX2UGH7_9BACT|nr:septum formation inhibitor Maf [Campylobacter helveticus]ARE80050.1 septum formation protein Maf [Campylobacter helveticus]MCR2040324.1 septum formation inhibitor Maf [Campylobacter helveticus]MCR2055538.1 septum formation inhibitor Maf [Campylobacter helveticus]TNB55517.1 septum formation inhibitor Maf [Campylobacter helveticus]TNB55650.1 septum formation inhibitor Maf [Campylobacter helveticus]
MLVLASSSKIRATLLQNEGIEFKQVSFDYDEGLTKDINASLYVQKIVLEKERQFCEKNTHKDENLLFTDSVVSVKGQILTKAKNDEEALKMLQMQSQNEVSILSAFLLQSPKKKIFSLSKTTLFLDKFDEDDLKTYIQSKLYLNKAGAIMCEGFHQKYILRQIGTLNTALGLDTQTLKAYL